MKKLTISVMLMFGLMMMIFATAVNAGTEDDTLNGVEFTSPDEGEWYADSIFAEWTNDNSVDDMTLKYQENSCDVGGIWDTLETDIDTGESTFDWDVSAMEGNFCLRLQESEEFAFSGQFCVDNTEPAILVDTEDHIVLEYDPSKYIQGIESDTWSQDTGSHVQVTFSDTSEQGNEVCDDCNLEWKIDWGDGTVISYNENSLGQGLANNVCIPNLIDDDVDYDCYHQYVDSDSDGPDNDGSNGDYEVTVTVYDCAGNENSDSDSVTVENIVPECEISAPSDAAVGQVVYFDGIISNHGDYLGEVDADMPTMDYSWDFGDGNGANGENVNHTYNADSFFDVFLTVDDGDGGVNTCHHEINVVEPTVLDAQEAAAFYPLDADFGDGVHRSFYTGLSTTTVCDIVMGPSNLRAIANVEAPNTCKIRWDRDISAHPTNDERGNHPIVIRASDASEGVGGGSYEYFAFDITVWSWMIDLTEGWNLISIPLVPEDNSIDTLILDQIFDSLPGGTEYSVFSYQYDGTDSEWLSSRRSGVGNLDTIMPGYAYWIKTTEDATIRGNGVTNEQLGFYPTVQVPRNAWMMVGRYGIVSLPWKKDNAGNQYLRRHGYLRSPVAFDSLHAEGDELHPRGVNEDGDLDIVEFIYNNVGYWLYVEDDNPLNDVESYTPLDEWYPENNGLSTDVPLA